VEAGDTAVIPPPPEETGPVPVHTTATEPQLYGVTPPMAVFALTLAAAAVAVVLLLLGELVAGLLALAAALLMGVAFVAIVARPLHGGAGGRARDRVRATATGISARAAARRDLGALLREREALRSRRSALLRSLGEAVYAGDEHGTQAVRAELEELDRAAADKEAEMQAVAERTRERVAQARLEAQPTEMVEIPEPSPAPVPEPGPVPSPQPGPIPVPEPVPAPSPAPGPVPVPEPTPVPSPPAESPRADAEPEPEEPEEPRGS
jgi:outer membrane biosynthesis protein TonB